jgi:signal transduction histidine kinase
MSLHVQKQPAAKEPTLFHQIAVRLALLTLAFALLDIAIVIVTYARQPEALAQELLTLEANRIAASPDKAPADNPGPPGAHHWSASYIDARSARLQAPDVRVSSAPSSTLMDWTQRERLGRSYRVTGVRPIAYQGQTRWLFMQYEGEGLRPYLPVIANELAQHVALPLVPLSLLLLIFNVVAVRQVLAPLRTAAQEIDGLRPDDMSSRVSAPAAPREVAALVRAMNSALDRLEEAMTVLQSFTANAAHELRTPLSIMQLSLERLPRGDIRSELQDDLTYLTRLVGQMLDLAQADAMTLQTAAVVDLAKIGRAVVAKLAVKAFEAERELVFVDHGGAFARGHEEAIFRILRNLVDNALVHAEGTTAIEVAAGPGPQLSVCDQGPGIAPEDRARIFDRFWRKDRGASSGAGLGLGIVKRLVDAHGATIAVDEARGGGACFRVRFPCPDLSQSDRHA